MLIIFHTVLGVLGQLSFLMVLVLCQLTCSGGLVDKASLWLPHSMGFTCQVVRGFSAFSPCVEHVRAGGGGSVENAPFNRS